MSDENSESNMPSLDLAGSKATESHRLWSSRTTPETMTVLLDLI